MLCSRRAPRFVCERGIGNGDLLRSGTCNYDPFKRGEIGAARMEQFLRGLFTPDGLHAVRSFCQLGSLAEKLGGSSDLSIFWAARKLSM
jgi:hypothetical protein